MERKKKTIYAWSLKDKESGELSSYLTDDELIFVRYKKYFNKNNYNPKYEKIIKVKITEV